MEWVKTEEEIPALKHNLSSGAKFSDLVLVYAKGSYWVSFLFKQENEFLWCLCNPVATVFMTIKLNDAACWALIPKPPKEYIGED